jgi:serine/threonine protein kinase
MKHVEGHLTLRELVTRLARGAPAEQALYTFEQRVQLVQQVCRALAYAHARGVCHRDLKPENILVGPCGEVYLADWGIAALRAGLTAEASGADAPDARKTSASRFAGTVAYMSPERLSGRAPEFDVDGDLYGLCAVLYELLTLEHYVTGGPVGDRQAMYERVLGNRYVEAKMHRDPVHGAVPPALSHILKRGLGRDRAARFQSADELYDALQRWIEGRAPVACPRTAIQRVLCGWGHFLDRHRIAGPAATFLGALAVLSCVLYTLVTLFSR